MNNMTSNRDVIKEQILRQIAEQTNNFKEQLRDYFPLEWLEANGVADYFEDGDYWYEYWAQRMAVMSENGGGVMLTFDRIEEPQTICIISRPDYGS